MDNARREPVQPLSEDDAAREARRLLSAWKPDEPATPTLRATSFRDDSKVPEIGDTPPVPQPDSRIVSQRAAGAAVVSIAIGAGSTGLGCAAWLALKGLSLVSVPSLQTVVLIILAPFVGAAILAVTVGAAIAKAKKASTTNVFKGSVQVTNKTEVTSTAKGLFARNRNDVRPS